MGQQINLGFINPNFSQKAMIYGLAKHLPKNKFRITLLQPSYNMLITGKSRIFEKNFNIIFFPSYSFPKIDYTIPIFSEELKLLIKLKYYDILHVGDYFYPTCIPPLMSNRNGNASMILSVNALPGFNWRFGLKIVDITAKAYTYSIGKLILNHYDKIIAIYNKLSEDLKRLGVPSHKISMIHNGVDCEKYKKVDQCQLIELKKQLKIQDNEKVILFVGRLTKVKRVEYVIKLTKKLINDGHNIKTIIIGDGPYHKNYVEQANGYMNRIIFKRWISPTKLPLYYAIADVVVLTSISEGLPNVLLEAAAAGKPVVSTNVGGISDIVIHNKTGFLVNPLDFDLFYKSANKLLTDSDLREEFSKNASIHVKMNFNWEIAVKKYENLCNEVLKSKV